MKYALTAIMLIFVAITSMAGVHLDFGLETRYSTIPDDPADTRISSGSAIWQTYGYYGIYKSGCVAVGMTAAGFASGFFIGGIFGEILGGKSYAEKEYRRGKIILWSGTAAAYGLALLGPKIVAHNLRQDDPNAPYDEILQSGLITEAACNAVGIGFLALGWSIEDGFLASALVVAGFLCFFVPTPAVMHAMYNNCERISPTNAVNMSLNALTFSITDYSNGSRDYSLKIDLAKGALDR